ncbi:MAG TPA: 4-phosphoerythronate dehydrogenase [Xanthomonadales bacterium]|nr:4-phosphoerythronate dehydrogenase [Xanthomonadales bacterium]
MHIVADENIPGLEESFGRFGNIQLCNGRTISSRELQQADVLLIRSVSRINQPLLVNSPVRFLGSATIGIDHLDTAALDEAGIHWCHAPGCNADGAAQYTLAMIVLAARRSGLQLTELKAGIVGLGNVGSRLMQLLKSLGVNEVLACDPPLADAGQAGLVGMADIAGCNLVSFHVPLTETGPYATRQLGNRHFFSQLQTGTLVVNNSRGAVLDAIALDDWLDAGRGHAVLDVWPDEPEIHGPLLEKVTVATPHVAGYSLDGKLNGTRMLFKQWLRWQGIEYAEPLPPFAPAANVLELPADSTVESAILAACPVERDDQALRAGFSYKNRITAKEFDQLRSNYPIRRDFVGITIAGSVSESLAERLCQFGFSTGPG